MAIRTEGKTTLRDLARRAHVLPQFAAQVYDIVSPGTTIVITDAPALRNVPANRVVFPTVRRNQSAQGFGESWVFQSFTLKPSNAFRRSVAELGAD